MCTDKAYLVSEVGSSAGNFPKECVLCVKRSPTGFLIKSTAQVLGAINRGAHHEVVQTDQSDPLELCGRFWTDGAGQGSGRFEVFKYGYFKVWEAIPDSSN